MHPDLISPEKHLPRLIVVAVGVHNAEVPVCLAEHVPDKEKTLPRIGMLSP